MRFSLPEDTELRPFVIATPEIFRGFDARTTAGELGFYDAFDESNRPFLEAMNRANCLAHDGTVVPRSEVNSLGMPRWVMLDCAILPAGMFGFEVPVDAIPPDVRTRLDPSGQLDWIGISEYSAIPTLDPETLMGISLFSLVQGRHLGIRTKALALKTLSAKHMSGVTQFDNPGLRVHIEFGPLEILSSTVAVHARPDESFVYRLEVPSDFILDEMIEGKEPPYPVRSIETTERMKVDPTHRRAAKALTRKLNDGKGGWYITDVGDVENGRVTSMIIGRLNG
jgi:hypothetical protein